MKICLLSDARSRHTRRYAQHLAKENEVHLITFSYMKKNELGVVQEEFYKDVENIYLHKVKKRFYLDPISLYTVKKTIKNINPDIVHAHQVTPYGVYAALAGVRSLIVSAWGSDISIEPERSPIIKYLVKNTLKKAILVQVSDKCGKMRLIELGCDAGRILVQPYGVDTRLFCPAARSEELRRELAIDDGFSVFNARHLRGGYNVDVFIRSIPYVIEKINNIKFLVGGIGPLRSKLEGLAKDLKVDDFVVFLGGIHNQDMPMYLTSVDVYVDTFYEPMELGGSGIGTTTMEVMACGTPHICANRISVREGGWFQGIMYNHPSAKDLADKILFLVKDKKLRENISELSRKKSLEIGDLGKNLQEWDDIYKDIIRR